MTSTTTEKPAAKIIASSGAGSATARKPRQSAASRKSAANSAAAKIAAAPKAQPGTAAKPAKPVSAKAAAGPTKTAQNRQIAAAMVKIVADGLAKWTPKQHDGITAERAALAMASWLNYAPIAADGWDDRLPDRSLAGGRGAKIRQSA
jgi:hypothetical protein